MASRHPKVGPNSTPAYQLSGIPFVTGSTATEVPGTDTEALKLELPYVSRFIQVENIGANPLRVGFSELGVSGTVTKNYFVLPISSGSNVLELRVKDTFFNTDHATNTTGYRLIAGLTPIERNEFPVLTGSGGFTGVG